METTESKSGEVLVISIQGNLDTASSGAFEERLVKLVEDGERQIVVECSRMEYVNSSGLKAFLVGAKRMDAAGGKFALCCLTANVQMVFETIGFDRILTIAPTAEDALRLLQTDAAPA